jgi:lipopolysaccharide transport system ATP-binding protein
MRPIIRVENLSKQYRIGTRGPAYRTLRDALTGFARAPFERLRRNGHSNSETIWALKDVSFEVYPGEVVGIIGRNGAGKSTLLKILSRITEPTTGRVELYGRVGSLLEVGTGFHPELTGRENIYLNGAILGMTRREIDKKFDEIVDFAEIEKFIDTPVKHYSSGMYMRLAFSVAAHLEPEILLVDEVLAVGDSSFQGKCLAYMKGLGAKGITVMFVSHNLLAVNDLCHRGLLLANGNLVRDCDVDTVIAEYRRVAENSTHSKNCIKENSGVRLVGMWFKGKRIEDEVFCNSGESIWVEAEIEVSRQIFDLILNLELELPNGETLLHLRSDMVGAAWNLLPGRYRLYVRTANLPIKPGIYSMLLRFVSLNSRSPLLLNSDKWLLIVEGKDPLSGYVSVQHSFDIRKEDSTRQH